MIDDDYDDMDEEDSLDEEEYPAAAVDDLRVLLPQITAALDGDINKWAGQCHAASLRIVRQGVFPSARVARGTCPRVRSQHSWVVVGDDCYSSTALIVDPTMEPGKVWFGCALDALHHPHGEGSIWAWGRPRRMGGPVIELTPKDQLSRDARAFLELLGPLDLAGWRLLANAPVKGWPAGEIFAAMSDTEEMESWIPIDILGMTTLRNPGRLYLP